MERIKAYENTGAFQKALRKRTVQVETLFAAAKQWHGSDRLRLGLLWRVKIQTLLIVENFQERSLTLRRAHWKAAAARTSTASTGSHRVSPRSRAIAEIGIACRHVSRQATSRPARVFICHMAKRPTILPQGGVDGTLAAAGCLRDAPGQVRLDGHAGLCRRIGSATSRNCRRGR